MRILVLSDSHGNSSLAFRAYSLAEPVDAVVHLGDGADDAELLRTLDAAMVSVAGNCDVGSPAPRELLWECGGKKLLLVHGDAYGVNRGLGRLEQRAIALSADAVLFGHSHTPTAVIRSGILFLNPGTLSRSSGHKSFAILDIADNRMTYSFRDIS
jgi:putative phosphoesterase